jgi:hypothetical protein
MYLKLYRFRQIIFVTSLLVTSVLVTMLLQNYNFETLPITVCFILLNVV